MSAHDDDQLVIDYLQRLRAAASTLPADLANELIKEITSHIAEARAAGPAALGDSPSVRNILERLGDPADIARTAAEPGFGEMSAGRPAPGSAAGGGYPATGGWPATGFPAGAVTASASRGSGAGAREIAIVILLLAGGFVFLVGWVIGVVLLWTSPRWRTRDKLLGTLVWPGGLLAPLALLVAGGLAVAIPASSQVCTSDSATAPQAPAAAVSAVSATGQNVASHVWSAASCTSTGGVAPWLVITMAVILMVLAIAGPIFTAIRLLRRAGRTPAESTADPAALLTV